MTNPIKLLIKNKCPHCYKEILVEIEHQIPAIKAVLTIGDIEDSKKSVIYKLEELYKKEELSKKDFDLAMEWVKSEDTIFGPNDIETIINSIIYKDSSKE